MTDYHHQQDHLEKIMEYLAKATARANDAFVSARVAMQVRNFEKPAGDYDGCISQTLNSVRATREFLDDAETILEAGRDFNTYDAEFSSPWRPDDFVVAFLSVPDPAADDDTRPKHIMLDFRFHMDASPRSMYYMCHGDIQFTLATFDWEQPEGTPLSLHLYRNQSNCYMVGVVRDNLKRLAQERGIEVTIS